MSGEEHEPRQEVMTQATMSQASRSRPRSRKSRFRPKSLFSRSAETAAISICGARYARAVMPARERAAMVALLRTGRRPWVEYAELVEERGSATAVLEEELARASGQATLFRHLASRR